MPGYYNYLFGKRGLAADEPKNGGKCLLDYFAEDDFVKYGRGGVSQNMIVMMPCDEYVSLCEPLKADDAKHHADLKKKVESGEIRKFDTIPLLRIRQMEDGTDAKVYGHDGRHRAKMMKELGFDEIPVRLYAENFVWGDEGEGGSRFVDRGSCGETASVQQQGGGMIGGGLRGWPKWLWGQNDKGMDKEKQKVKFPVTREDSGRAFDRGALMANDGDAVKRLRQLGRAADAAPALDGGKKKVYRDELGRLIGTAQMECGVLVFRDHMGRRVASGAFDNATCVEE